jgi:hypothetical protein
MTPIVISIANDHLLFNTLGLKYEENADHNDSDADKCQNHKERFGGHSILGTQRISFGPFLSFWLFWFFWLFWLFLIGASASFRPVASQTKEDLTEDPPV